MSTRMLRKNWDWITILMVGIGIGLDAQARGALRVNPAFFTTFFRRKSVPIESHRLPESGFVSLLFTSNPKKGTKAAR
jgi:hypothetical protein